MLLQHYLLIKTGLPNPNAIKTEFSDLYLLPPGWKPPLGTPPGNTALKKLICVAGLWVWHQGKGMREADLSIKMKGV